MKVRTLTFSRQWECSVTGLNTRQTVTYSRKEKTNKKTNQPKKPTFLELIFVAFKWTFIAFMTKHGNCWAPFLIHSYPLSIYLPFPRWMWGDWTGCNKVAEQRQTELTWTEIKWFRWAKKKKNQCKAEVPATWFMDTARAKSLHVLTMVWWGQLSKTDFLAWI